MTSPDRQAQLKRILIGSENRREISDGGAIERMPGEEGLAEETVLRSRDPVLERVDTILTHGSPCEEDEPAGFNYQAARDALFKHGEKALRKLEAGDDTLTTNQIGALEAIVIADGSRPSFLLSGGAPDLNDPLMGTWAETVSAHYKAMAKIARVVGRIQPAGGHASKFLGTGTLIDAERGLILTNYHVVDDARRKLKIAMEPDGTGLKVLGELHIDFLGEANSTDTNRYRITRFDLPEKFGRGFGFVDAAIGVIVPMDESAPLSGTVPLLTRQASYAAGGVTSLATIGFPGPPVATTGVTNGEHGPIDWQYVTKVLFKGQFGFKRLAPGLFTSPLKSSPYDSLGAVIGHDATTFGGASGSLMIAWADESSPSFALHFSGSLGSENHALSFHKTADALARVGAPIA